ncbi:MAG TPA: type I-U CRISPR-associated RAMP protein Csb1/Cas7u [Chloroflexota bacterium]|nr:type I-U CRISPR-associated RAMP protein Csb1/Cas7u [Chloroflexota bacterium]
MVKSHTEAPVGIALSELSDVVENDAAIRRVMRLQPAGGRGDKLYPPTYPGVRANDPAQQIFEERRIDGQQVKCVLLDSVQSQANRLEEALLRAVRSGRFSLPMVAVDFVGCSKDGMDLSDLGAITSLEAPHRIFDAIIRDSVLDGTRFTDTADYRQLMLAKPDNALEVFRLSPTSLLFGVWNSTGEGGGLGAKFTRCLVSEIIGVGADPGISGAVRLDPLGIRATVKLVGGPLDYEVVKQDVRGKKTVRPSEVNHSNVISTPVERGVTVDYALHTAVVTCAGLRRLSFPGAASDAAGRVVLAALGLAALKEQDVSGYALRSRCDLVPEQAASFEVVHPEGGTTAFEMSRGEASDLVRQASEHARSSGYPWPEEPVRLVPQERLIELVVASREIALAADGDGAER